MRRGSGSRRGTSATLLIEGYSDLVEIGAGTSATVYRAFQEAFQRQVALKLLTADIRDQRTQKRFVSERAMTGRLSRHPNVITVYDSGFAAGRRPYLAMEYFARGSYADLIDASGPLPLADALRVGVKIAGALESAHRAGVIHRDIKPQNILLSSFGEPVLADFGLAVPLDPEASFTAGLTPAHAAPELIEGGLPTVATDIYALGSTLYALLAGRGPFTGPAGEGLLAQFRRIAVGDVPDIPRGDLPPTVMATLRRTLATSPDDRFRTAAELGRALQNEQRTLGAPVTELVLEAETAVPPTSRSIVDTRSTEETATRADNATPPDGLTLPGRMPVAAPPPTPRRSRKAATIAVCGGIVVVAAGTGVGIAARGFSGSTAATAGPATAVVPRSVVPRSPAVGSAPPAGGSPTPPVAPQAAVTPSDSPPMQDSAVAADNTAPTDVRAKASGRQVLLTWRDHTGGTAPYLILVSTDAGYGPRVAPPRGTTSAIIPLTSATTPTCFTVKAVISLGNTPAAPPVCINGGVAPPIATPSP